MWLQFVLVGFLFKNTWAFSLAPICWGAALDRIFVVAPQTCPSKGFFLNKAHLANRAMPEMLVLRDASGISAPEVIPQFAAKADNTISWDAAGLCIEAAGYKSADSISVNQCSGRPTQLWNFVPSRHGQNHQIRLKDTDKCMVVSTYVNEKGGLNGAPIELRECMDKKTETWRLGGPVAVPLVARYGARQQAITISFALFVGFGSLFVTVIVMAGIRASTASATIWGTFSALATTLYTGVANLLMRSLGWSARAAAANTAQDSVFLRVDPWQNGPPRIDVPSNSVTPVLRSISGITEAVTAATTELRRSSDIKMFDFFGNTEDSKKRRVDVSFRTAPPGSRVMTFRRRVHSPPVCNMEGPSRYEGEAMNEVNALMKELVRQERVGNENKSSANINKTGPSEKKLAANINKTIPSEKNLALMAELAEVAEEKVDALMAMSRLQRRVGYASETGAAETLGTAPPLSPSPPESPPPMEIEAPAEPAESAADMHKPSASGSWGVFERPRNISEAYGGGRRVGADVTEKEVATSNIRLNALLEKYGVEQRADEDEEKTHRNEIENAVKEARQMMGRGATKEALDALLRVKDWCRYSTDLGSETLLELGMVMVAHGDPESAEAIFKRVAVNAPDRRIYKAARAMLFQGAALELVKPSERDKEMSKLFDSIVITPMEERLWKSEKDRKRRGKRPW